MDYSRFIGWIWLTAVPCTVFGLALAFCGMRYDRMYGRRPRLVLGTLAACLIASTGITTERVYGAVIYDICKDPTILESWLWWLWCAL